jgi:hypothetical protein
VWTHTHTHTHTLIVESLRQVTGEIMITKLFKAGFS